jgi:hypothetical protein
MQEEKIVLPKFTMPGQRNWVVYALAGVGGLVVVSVIMFAVVVSKGGAVPSAAAARANVAEAPLAASAMPVPVAQPKAIALAAVAPTSPPDVAKEASPAKPVRSSSHRPHHGRTKALAKAGSAGGHPHSWKPDALDELLKRFK